MKKMVLKLATAFFVIILCYPTFGDEVNIIGPSNIQVVAGQPVGVEYAAQCADMKGYSFKYSNIPSGIKVYHEYGSSLVSPPIFIVGYKPGVYSFSADATVMLNSIERVTQDMWRYAQRSSSKPVTVTVLSGNNLCINGGISEYASRSRTFFVDIENYSSKPITILSNKAKAIHYGSKKKDRKL